MSNFLDDYGVAEARRGRILKFILVALLVLVVAGGALYFSFRNYREQKQAKMFLNLLRDRRYEQAYRLWGCTPASPCRDYSFEKFLEDWGPDSPHADLARMEVVHTRSCSQGIIQILRFGQDDEVRLWVSRGDLTLGFAPWPICDPRIPASGL
jgi:hypothetical protein